MTPIPPRVTGEPTKRVEWTAPCPRCGADCVWSQPNPNLAENAQATVHCPCPPNRTERPMCPCGGELTVWCLDCGDWVCDDCGCPEHPACPPKETPNG